MAEKILASHSGRKEVRPGEFVIASVDGSLAHDGGVREIPKLLEELGVTELKVPFVVTLDHFAPAPNHYYAEVHKKGREYCEKQGVPLNDVCTGIHLQLPIEAGMCLPGMLFVGGDSHTTMLGALGALATGVGGSEVAAILATGRLWFKVPETIRVNLTGKLPDMCMGKDAILHILRDLKTTGASYKVLEFGGEGLGSLTMDARLSMANMAVEMDGKAGIFEADGTTLEYLRTVTDKPLERFGPDPGAGYKEVYELRLSDVEPLATCPPRIDNVKPIREIEGKRIDQALVGTCTNGRLEDIRIAAGIVKGKRIARHVRFFVCPASQKVFRQALDEGLVAALADAGAVFLPPSCGPDCGLHLGMLADGEVEIGSSNRNTAGRRGSFKAEIYSASPATVAASAVEGRITDPRKFA